MSPPLGLSRWGGLALIALIGIAACLRLARLSDASLDFDEYLHVFAAKAWLTSGEPSLPSGEAYTRAFPYTRLVALSMRWLGSSEAAVRLPSVVCGVLLVALAGWIAFRWWGRGAALAVMLLAAVDPYCLQMSQVCRMYAPFHVLYLMVLFAVYEGLEGGGRLRRQRALWWAVAALATGLAVSLHKLTADVWVGIAAYVGGRAAMTRRPKYWVPIALAVAALLAASIVGAVDLGRLWHRVNSAPAYASSTRYDQGFYWHRFWAVDPWLVGAMIPAWLWWLRRDTKRAWYVLCAVLVPFGLHSFIFDWKEERYLLHVIPVMLLVVGSALWGAARWIGERAARLLPRRDAVATSWSAALIAGVLLTPMVSSASAHRSLRGLDGDTAKWREAYAALKPALRPEDALIISVPLVSAYYANRLPDYLLLNVLIQDTGRPSDRSADGWYRDRYSGRPLITTARELEAVFERHARGWIVVDAARFEYESCVPSEVRALIRRHGSRWASPDPSVLIYAWGPER